MNTCINKTTLGKECSAMAMEGSEYCFFHDPREEFVQKRKKAVLDGGKQGKLRAPLPPVVVKNLDDLASLIELTINDLRAGRMGTNEANAVCYLSSTLTKVFETRDISVKIQAIDVTLRGRDKNDR